MGDFPVPRVIFESLETIHVDPMSLVHQKFTRVASCTVILGRIDKILSGCVSHEYPTVL